MHLGRRLFPAAIAALFAWRARAQFPPDPDADPRDPHRLPDPDRLPNGKSRSNAIASDKHEKAIEEIDRLIQVAKDLRKEVEQAGKYVVPVSAVRKTEDIEKLAKSIRGQLRG
jgi:hypothetical protein